MALKYSDIAQEGLEEKGQRCAGRVRLFRIYFPIFISIFPGSVLTILGILIESMPFLLSASIALRSASSGSENERENCGVSISEEISDLASLLFSILAFSVSVDEIVSVPSFA